MPDLADQIVNAVAHVIVHSASNAMDTHSPVFVEEVANDLRPLAEAVRVMEEIDRVPFGRVDHIRRETSEMTIHRLARTFIAKMQKEVDDAK